VLSCSSSLKANLTSAALECRNGDQHGQRSVPDENAPFDRDIGVGEPLVRDHGPVHGRRRKSIIGDARDRDEVIRPFIAWMLQQNRQGLMKSIVAMEGSALDRIASAIGGEAVPGLLLPGGLEQLTAYDKAAESKQNVPPFVCSALLFQQISHSMTS